MDESSEDEESEDVILGHSDEEVASFVEGDDPQKARDNKSGKKSYERMAGEAQHQEDAEYLQYRQKKLA